MPGGEDDCKFGISCTDAAGQDNVLRGTDDSDMLNGLDGDDILYGRGCNDLLKGGAGTDQLWGGSGKDTLIGGDGSDIYHGGSGIDVAVFSGSIDSYKFFKDNGNLYVQSKAGGDGVTDTVFSDVEKLVFGVDGKDVNLQKGANCTAVLTGLDNQTLYNFSDLLNQALDCGAKVDGDFVV